MVELSKGSNFKAFDLPFKRFNLTYMRESNEDKLIDLTIALESSLLYGIRDELKYRLSLRGVALLSKKMDVSKIKGLLNLIYDTRSKVVHEGKTIYEFKKLENKLNEINVKKENFITECEELTRKVLKTLLLDYEGKSLAEFIETLDKLIFSSFETHERRKAK